MLITVRLLQQKLLWIEKLAVQEASVELSDDELAKKAIEELNQASYDGKVINITEARPREDRGDRGGRFNNNRGGGYGSNRGGGYGSNRGGGYGSNRDGGRY